MCLVNKNKKPLIFSQHENKDNKLTEVGNSMVRQYAIHIISYSIFNQLHLKKSFSPSLSLHVRIPESIHKLNHHYCGENTWEEGRHLYVSLRALLTNKAFLQPTSLLFPSPSRIHKPQHGLFVPRLNIHPITALLLRGISTGPFGPVILDVSSEYSSLDNRNQYG